MIRLDPDRVRLAQLRPGEPISGPLLSAELSGWAIIATGWRRDRRHQIAHWFHRGADGRASTACGKLQGIIGELREAGTHHRCVWCRRSHKEPGREGMNDRVRWPNQNHNGHLEGTLIGTCGVDGSCHAVIKTDDGKYRSVPILLIRDVMAKDPNP